MLHFRNMLSVAALVGAMLASSSRAASWQSIKPAQTPEKDLIAEFGPPDEIVATFPWVEWSARWKIRPRTTSYVLRYHSDPVKSEILAGPGGSADRAEVHIYDGKVGSISWDYGGQSARAAAALLRADPEISFDAPESPTFGSKAGPHGRVFVELGRGDTQVRIVYDLK